MNEQQTQAGSSSAEDVFRGEQVSLDEYSRYRDEGKLPARFKPAEEAESAPADAPEETVEPAVEETETDPDSEPEKTQEPPPKGTEAQKRILQLLAENKELKRKAESAAKPAVQASPSPQPQQPIAEPQPEDKKPDGTPRFETYEQYVKALARWEAAQEWAEREKAYIAQTQAQQLTAKVEEARTRYENFNEVFDQASPTFAAIVTDQSIAPAVKAMLNDSDVLPDLVFTIGSDAKELQSFIRMAQTEPGKALRYIAKVESLIIEERSKESSGGKAPEKKQTSAPKPPSPVNGASSRAFDVSDESLSPEEWMRKRTADLKKRGKG